MKYVFCISGLVLVIAISPVRAQQLIHVFLNSENSILPETEYSGTVTICADGLPIHTEEISGETGFFGEFKWTAPDTLSIPADRTIAYQIVVEADGEIVDSGKVPWVPVGNARNAEFAVDAGYAENAFKADQARVICPPEFLEDGQYFTAVELDSNISTPVPIFIGPQEMGPILGGSDEYVQFMRSRYGLPVTDPSSLLTYELTRNNGQSQWVLKSFPPGLQPADLSSDFPFDTTYTEAEIRENPEILVDRVLYKANDTGRIFTREDLIYEVIGGAPAGSSQGNVLDTITYARPVDALPDPRAQIQVYDNLGSFYPSNDGDETLHLFEGEMQVEAGVNQVELNTQKGDNNYGLFTSQPLTASEYQIFSDATLKTDIRDLGPATESLMQLRPSRFAFKHAPGRERIGLLAQDVQRVFPELVSRVPAGDVNIGGNASGDLLTVNYDGLIPILVKTIQEQQKQLDALREEIDAMQAENE